MTSRLTLKLEGHQTPPTPYECAAQTLTDIKRRFAEGVGVFDVDVIYAETFALNNSSEIVDLYAGLDAYGNASQMTKMLMLKVTVEDSSHADVDVQITAAANPLIVFSNAPVMLIRHGCSVMFLAGTLGATSEWSLGPTSGKFTITEGNAEAANVTVEAWGRK